MLDKMPLASTDFIFPKNPLVQFKEMHEDLYCYITPEPIDLMLLREVFLIPGSAQG